MSGRNTNGTFARGNPGGPGRPARPIERDYLRALADACPPDAWRAIVERAVADATNGDAKARAWLAGYLLGPQPEPGTLPLLADAVDDVLAVNPIELNAQQRHDAIKLAEMTRMFPTPR